MTSSMKTYLRICEKFEHGQIHSLCQAIFDYCKALPVMAGYRRDVTGDRLLAQSFATMLRNGSVAMVL